MKFQNLLLSSLNNRTFSSGVSHILKYHPKSCFKFTNNSLRMFFFCLQKCQVFLKLLYEKICQKVF